MAAKIPSSDLIKAQFPNISYLGNPTRGGQKVVYHAKIGSHDEALKLFQIPHLLDGLEKDDIDAFRREVVQRVHREVELLGRCKSPYIVKLGQIAPIFKELEGEEYIIYSEEFLNGSNLWDILRAGGDKPNEGELKRLLFCLLHSIRELWKLRAVHRDIKPHNVLKLNSKDRSFVLLDLGIAFSIIDTPLTVNASDRLPPATYRYVAPEMLEPDFRKNIDFRADLYAAGLTIYEYAAQKHPIARNHDDQFTTISRAVKVTPEPLHQKRPELSDEFCELIDQMLKKTPALRPSNLDELIMRMEER